MEAIVERCKRCIGLDVHQATVVACLLVGPATGRARKEIRTFGTTTTELEELRAWLKEEGCTHAAMESTGVYWMPVYAVLEEHVQLVVGNAAHIKNVPGRKTDVKDAEWIANLLRHGLIRKSFVPPKWQRAMRDLVRYRRKLVESQSAERNRLIRLLETCNIKLATVASDVFGVSGRAMLRALIEGTSSPQQMAELARGSLRRKLEPLARALNGKLDEHHRFLLRLQLERVERIETDIAKVDVEIDAAVARHSESYQRLIQIPGIDRVAAVTVIAELGTDMTVFPSAKHAAAWAGVSPGNSESAGKRLQRGKRRGNVHLCTALVQAALCAARKKGSYLKERFWRLKARRGPKRAAVAVAHNLLVIAYHMLRDNLDYKDLGPDHCDRIAKRSTQRRLVKKLEALGYSVSLAPV